LRQLISFIIVFFYANNGNGGVGLGS
jgi:hypothetical protein